MALAFINKNAQPIYYLQRDLDKADVLMYNFNRGTKPPFYESFRNITKYSDVDEMQRRYKNFLYRECKIK